MVPALTVPSRVPQAIFGLASHLSCDSAVAAINTLEAGFYGSLKGGMLETGRLVNWIRETSIARIHAIQVIFNLANVGLVLFGTVKLVNEAVDRFPFSQITVGGNSPLIKGTSVLVALAATVTLGVVGLNRFSPALAPTREEDGVQITETLSNQQKIAKLLHMSKLILNVGLACLVKNRFWFAISLAGSSYSLLKNMQLKWINFASTTLNPGPGEIRAAQATYKMLSLPPAGAEAKEECLICTENPPDIAFCAKHVFCQICISQVIKNKSSAFLNQLQLTKVATRHYHNHVYSHTSYSYRAVIPQENLPSCSLCRDIPIHNGLDIQVRETYNAYNARVTITRPPVDRQYLYDNLYPIYNAVQAGLSLLQTYPELAGTIFKIQKLMLVTDFIGFAFTAYYAYNKAAEKLKFQNSKIAKVAALAIVITTAALSYTAVLKLNAFLKSAIILKQLLEQLPIPPEALRGITVDWHSPFSRTLMQCLYINRMVASMALAYFSKDRKKNLFNAAAQLTSLVGVSKLKWIAFSQTFEQPLRKIVAEGGALHGMLHTTTLKSLTLRTYSLANLSKDLKSTLQSIYSASNAFFQKSTWERYWWVTYNHGIETGRKLIYRVTLQKNSLEEFAKNSFLQGLTGYDIDATDAISYYTPHVHAQ